MPKCYRCGTKLTADDESSSWRCRFYGCGACGSQYCKRIGRGLCDRWLMPLTLPLYSVISHKHPEVMAESVAREFSCSDKAEEIIAHCEEELLNPKQRLVDIHNPACRDEKKMRDFLRSFVDNWHALRAQCGNMMETAGDYDN